MKPKQLKDKKIDIRLEPGLKKILEKLAQKENRTLSDFIRQVLKRLIEDNKEGHK